jgi:AcrR family transcriptional regulator
LTLWDDHATFLGMAAAASSRRSPALTPPGRSKVKSKGKAAVASLDDDVRGRVLNAAVKLIDHGGLAGLSMREVARAAGVSHQAPYHYFEDREAIFAALAQEGFNILALRLENDMTSTERAVDRFVRAGQTYVEFALDHPALFRIMFRPDVVTMDRFPETRACGERAFKMLPALVQDCIAEGLPADPSVQALVILAWSVPHGLACLLLDGPLAMKIPDAAIAREQVTRDVMAAMRGLLLARSAPAAGRRGTRTKAPKARRRTS